jgi:hypothetical protein
VPKACDVVDLPGGGRAIVCGGGRRTPKCSFCKERPGSKQCDYPINGSKGGGNTCDAHICTECALHLEPDNDYCPMHKEKVYQVPATCNDCGESSFTVAYSSAVLHKTIMCSKCRKEK